MILKGWSQKLRQIVGGPGEMQNVDSGIWSAKLTYTQIIDDIFNYLKISSIYLMRAFIELKISSNYY
jgi:hypothetical protein